MAKAASKIPQRIRNQQPNRARIDRNRIELVHVEKMPPQLTERQLAMVCKVDAEKRKSTGLPPTFLETLKDETCSECRPPETVLEKYGIPPTWRHIPWDDVELMKHSLLDRECHRFAEAPIPDEVEMKRMGLIDSECQRAPVPIDESVEKKAAKVGHKAHQQLQMVRKRDKDALQWKMNQPHITVCPDVEILDSDVSAKEPFSSTSTVMLTAHPSGDSAGSADKEGPLTESLQSGPKLAVMPSMSNLGVVTHANPEMATGTEPFVVTKTIETADGQFEFSINFEVRFKPKPQESATEGS